MTKDPGLDALTADLPAAIRKLLRRCLEKDPRRRLQAIGEARIAPEEALAGAPGEETAAPLAPPELPRRRGLLPWPVAAVLLIALVAVLVVHFRETPPAAPTTRFQVLPPEKATACEFPTISPDGRRLAFVATVEGKTLLWVRPLDSLAAQPLAGTEDATFPFWSPDSRFLGFFSGGKLKKVDVSGGPPQTLCNAETPSRGGTWPPAMTVVMNWAGRSP